MVGRRRPPVALGCLAVCLGVLLATASAVSLSSLVYATYLGGSETDMAHAVAVDGAGHVFVAGGTFSPDFPTTPGAYDTTFAGGDGFIVKFNATGVAQYVTLFGGSDGDNIFDVAADPVGNLYLLGTTTSSDLPTTVGAFASSYGGNFDAFVAKLSPDGTTLLFSTYLGGSGRDDAVALDIDDAGSVYVTGWTTSRDFPVTPGAFASSFPGSSATFVAKLSPDGQTLLYATYLGGVSGDLPHDLAVDGGGNAVVIGGAESEDFPVTQGSYDSTRNGQTDAYVVKFNPEGTGLVFGTYLGGSDLDLPQAVAIDGVGGIHVVGVTYSNDFPTTADALSPTPNGGTDDAFVSRFDEAGTSLRYSSFLGGGGSDAAFDVAADASGSVYVAGTTFSADFPTTPDALEAAYLGNGDAFMVRLGAGGASLSYSTYLGGRLSTEAMGALALDVTGDVVLTGGTDSTDFPLSPGAYDTSYGGMQDAFVLSMRPPTPSPGSGGEAPEFPALILIVVGVGGASAAVALVLWQVRRRRQRPPV